MTRLTDDFGDLEECKGCMGLNAEDSCYTAFTCSSLHNALDLLSEYESTGLTPSEIKEIAKKKKCKAQ